MGYRVITDQQKDDYRKLRNKGWNRAEAARSAGFSYGTAKNIDMGWHPGKKAGRPRDDIAKIPRPRYLGDLSDEARRALDDFAYFRRRYFGRISSPWQEEAGQLAVQLLETPQKEFVVVNCPPGAGKSVLFAHDIPAWLTARNRSIRGIIGSRTFRQAKVYTGRLKRTFERTIPVQADTAERDKGRAYDGEATLAEDYGAFKPDHSELWRSEEFIVAQSDGQPIDEKEPTWTAFGMDSGSLGWRVNFVVWDDLVDKTTIRTVEAQENQRSWWDDEAETRLEPDGCLFLQGQRLHANDLYRYCLDKLGGDPDEVDEHRPKQYHHIVFKAHYEDKCADKHRLRDAEPYPNGCLLDPVRLSWRELSAKQRNNQSKYRVVYQQEDVDPATVLVPKLWIDGGRGSDGVDYPGCWDPKRKACELPNGLAPPVYSIATADPSPTKFWSIQWWAYHPDTEQRFLLDLIRQAMDAPDFLDWNHNHGCFSGVMEEWQQRSADLGIPISHWVVEANAAQRFMLQYDHVRRWQAKRRVDIVPHQTHRNKTDPDFGVQTIAPHYRYGRIRLPGDPHDPGRLASMKLVDEVTRWPDSQTDDCVMGHWFLEWNLPNLAPKETALPKRWTPSWFRGAA